jgi:hypothetical protein
MRGTLAGAHFGKKNSRVALAVGASVALSAISVMSSTASAAVLGMDNAADPAYSGGWNSGSNGGFGLGAWTLNPSPNTTQAGFFIGDSTDNGGGGSGNPGSSLGINSSGKAFGLYANSGQTAEAIRLFGGTIATGETLSFEMDNGYINNPGSDGITLRAGATNRFEFYFNGGDSDYTINDGTGTHNSGIGYTDGGLSLAYTVTGPNSYSLAVTPANGGSTSTYTGTLMGSPGSDDIDTFRAFDFNSSNGTPGNFYINNIVVPEPMNAALIGAFGAILLLRRQPKELGNQMAA